MTPQAINSAIARELGMKKGGEIGLTHADGTFWYKAEPNVRGVHSPQNICFSSELDLMSTIEPEYKEETNDRAYLYWWELEKVVNGVAIWMLDLPRWSRIARATAAQRSEAWCRWKGIWRE